MAAPSTNFVPYDDRDGWIWLDGVMTPWRESRIHVLTHSLHYGSCVFEGERAYEGKVFRSTDHSKRLHKSAELVGYKCPVPVSELDQIKLEVMARNGLSDCYVRAFSWRGSEMMGVSAQQASIRTCVAVWHWGNYFGQEQGHPRHHVGLEEAIARHDPVGGESSRPLHDLHHVEAQGGSRGLC